MSSFHQVSDRRKVLKGVEQKIDTSKEILRFMKVESLRKFKKVYES